MSKTKLPSVPVVPSDTGSARSFHSAVKEIVEVWKGERGDLLDSVVTFRALLGDAGTVLGTDNFTGLPIISALGSATSGTTTVSTVPPDVTSLTSVGVFTDIILSWDAAVYSNHAFTEVWRFTTDTLASKTLIGTTRASVYTDATGEGKTYYYWARHVSTSDVVGNFSLSGVVGTTQSTLDASYLTALSVGSAQIANLAVSDAKIASLTAAKITAGTMVAGESITVGSGGNRIVIDSYGSIRTGSITGFGSGSGFWMGENAGAASFFFGNSATEYASFNGTNLTINTPQFQLIGGNAIFSGALSAASGTFSGALSAATGTFAGSLTAVTGTLNTLAIVTGGHINSGQTAYATGNGFWLENTVSGTKFSMGEGTAGVLTKGFSYNGATNTFNVEGQLIATGNILNNAVTNVATSFTAAALIVAPLTWNLCQTVTITSNGFNTLIVFSGNNSSAGTFNGVRLYRDAVLLLDTGANLNDQKMVSFSVLDTPTSGARVYKVNAYNGSNSSNLGISNRSLTAMEFKK